MAETYVLYEFIYFVDSEIPLVNLVRINIGWNEVARIVNSRPIRYDGLKQIEYSYYKPVETNALVKLYESCRQADKFPTMKENNLLQ